ncbi:hypothetical protein GLOTRDRAFT_91335 [Gloeophyllum trabeum ATCC 11539]|uniref:Uncharacterized protein n=1 Tax=Gloeophyllum trabeum (strain ATCC 11539 / FP-39264 / Madison 617) TaxID=670483 RepID=S7QJK3_GLOTA|nr:uncharacterized protein GLOTRDRAFT_91335 [Gloeophyllum trabeum ATCC 11539]EPQ59876.1 hypothetical protein GLOTRDRAFT_91335 [Gloeophyllum trabeum ATCC 11539]
MGLAPWGSTEAGGWPAAGSAAGPSTTTSSGGSTWPTQSQPQPLPDPLEQMSAPKPAAMQKRGPHVNTNRSQKPGEELQPYLARRRQIMEHQWGRRKTNANVYQWYLDGDDRHVRERVTNDNRQSTLEGVDYSKIFYDPINDEWDVYDNVLEDPLPPGEDPYSCFDNDDFGFSDEEERPAAPQEPGQSDPMESTPAATRTPPIPAIGLPIEREPSTPPIAIERVTSTAPCYPASNPDPPTPAPCLGHASTPHVPSPELARRPSVAGEGSRTEYWNMVDEIHPPAPPSSSGMSQDGPSTSSWSEMRLDDDDDAAWVVTAGGSTDSDRRGTEDVQMEEGAGDEAQQGQLADNEGDEEEEDADDGGAKTKTRRQLLERRYGLRVPKDDGEDNQGEAEETARWLMLIREMNLDFIQHQTVRVKASCTRLLRWLKGDDDLPVRDSVFHAVNRRTNLPAGIRLCRKGARFWVISTATEPSIWLTTSVDANHAINIVEDLVGAGRMNRLGAVLAALGIRQAGPVDLPQHRYELPKVERVPFYYREPGHDGPSLYAIHHGGGECLDDVPGGGIWEEALLEGEITVIVGQYNLMTGQGNQEVLCSCIRKSANL